MMDDEAVFVIVGGGIAGVSCAETLAYLEPNKSIILLSESSLIKTAINLQAITRTLTKFDVEEKSSASLTNKYTNINIIHDILIEIDDINNCVKTATNKIIKYRYLCLCMGAESKLIPQAATIPQILGIRDTDSVDTFINKLEKSRRIVIVGNGGIASELVYKIKNIEIHWVIKDKHISATFVDPGAAEFFQSALTDCDKIENRTTNKLQKRMRYGQENGISGAALGPDWYSNLIIAGANKLDSSIKVHYETEINDVKLSDSEQYPVEVILSNSERIQCDLIVSATGVNPRINFKTTNNNIVMSANNSIQVDQNFRTSVKNIYAAGDICQTNWPPAKHWFQMKLWTQARQMGCFAAKSMCSDLNGDTELMQDFCFELFAHSTKLFGYKVILLGLFNGQKLGSNYEILLRMTKGKEYVKFVLEDNRLQGAVLIGETDLEETCENLILNQLDLSPYGDDILDPNIDIEDYFD